MFLVGYVERKCSTSISLGNRMAGYLRGVATKLRENVVIVAVRVLLTPYLFLTLFVGVSGIFSESSGGSMSALIFLGGRSNTVTAGLILPAST